MKITFYILALFIFKISFGQQPKYSFKSFVKIIDTIEFKTIQPANGNGFLRTFIQTNTIVWDIDDNNTTFIKGNVEVLICFEGQKKNGKREGIFNLFLIDSVNHNIKYKIGEQTFLNDQLNGEWRTYTLKGTLVHTETFKDNQNNGPTRNYWIDGKKIINEFLYFYGKEKYIEKLFFDNGKIKSEIPFENKEINGVGKKYYESGVIQEITEFKDGVFNGTRKYFYPTGQLWIEQIYKMGKSWTIVANYNQNGYKRNAGTLKDGDGTIIFYNEDGSIREIKQFINGLEK